jgi:hypothetical protein
MVHEARMQDGDGGKQPADAYVGAPETSRGPAPAGLLADR